MSAPAQVLIQRYRCPEAFLKNITLTDRLSDDVGFFRFGPGTTCYGRSSAGYRRERFEPNLYDASNDVVSNISKVSLSFDPTEIVDNLRQERYCGTRYSRIRARAKEAYYFLRPVLHPSVRRQVQRLQLRGWRELQFPCWPVDRTVEDICEQLLLLALKASGADRIPFIWFWPEGATSCVVMTHDVESEVGRNSCVDLMDIDDSFGIKASFQIVPEHRYSISSQFLATIRNRGFEINIQDLNHDGRLFNERKEFLRRATLINKYAKAYGAKGFRAAVLYRKPEWYDAFEFSFDMSVPNVAHLDPQRGGCCTVMPYFIGNILELPVTTTQDYVLFHLLDERSIELWKKQIGLILDKNGFVSFIVHPDYVMHDEVSSIYRDLLNYLRELKAARDVWVTLPSEVDRWWRTRSKMQLVPSGNEWRIEGEDAERAVVAYARNADGKLVYEWN
jgi:hypothetical protein